MLSLLAALVSLPVPPCVYRTDALPCPSPSTDDADNHQGVPRPSPSPSMDEWDYTHTAYVARYGGDIEVALSSTGGAPCDVLGAWVPQAGYDPCVDASTGAPPSLPPPPPPNDWIEQEPCCVVFDPVHGMYLRFACDDWSILYTSRVMQPCSAVNCDVTENTTIIGYVPCEPVREPSMFEPWMCWQSGVPRYDYDSPCYHRNMPWRS